MLNLRLEKKIVNCVLIESNMWIIAIKVILYVLDFKLKNNTITIEW